MRLSLALGLSSGDAEYLGEGANISASQLNRPFHDRKICHPALGLYFVMSRGRLPLFHY